jgi:hypothetical protein
MFLRLLIMSSEFITVNRSKSGIRKGKGELHQPRNPVWDYFGIRKHVEVLDNWGDRPTARTLFE